jgi:hypothetical protein
MITIITNIEVREEYLDQYLSIASLLTTTFFRKVGCLNYSIHQNKNNTTAFVLYEQWESDTHLEQHFEVLSGILGSPVEGEKIPAALTKMYVSAVPQFYRQIRT